MSESPSEYLSEIDVYYDHQRGTYLTKNDRGGWISMNETSIKRLLKSFGYSTNPPKGLLVSPLDEMLVRIQQENDVAFAGSIAGYRAGICEVFGSRILVTESPKLIEPCPGEWSVLKKVLEGLLNDPICDQRPYFYGWMQVSIKALRDNHRRPGQALVLAGPRDCGKSLLQNLITELFGGRTAKPYQFMTGLTSFNSDLFSGEHLMIEDETASTDIRARRNFGAMLKNFTVNKTQRHHAKNRSPIMLEPFWRLSISVNDEPENLMVLPPIDDSIEDKIMLLKAHKKEFPMPTNTDEEAKAFWSTLISELPAFIDWILKWEIPINLKSRRFGITHYHHPDILRAIDDLSPEQRLLSLIDMELFSVPENGFWEGSAAELERRLTGENSECAYEARRLLSFNTACGSYLGRLAKKHSNRIKQQRTNDLRGWKILSPYSPLVTA